jgi:hypothetical protein
MKRFSALMLGAAMVLGSAFAAQETAKTPEKPATTKAATKKHAKKTKKTSKKVAASTAKTTPAPAAAK